MRLQSRLTVSTLLAALLPLISAMVIVLFTSAEQTRNLTLEKAQGNLDAAAERLSSYFLARKAEVTAYAHTPLLQSMRFAAIRPFLIDELKRHGPVYEKFILGDIQGHFYNTAGGNPHFGGLRTFDDSSATARPKTIAKRDYWQRTVGMNRGATAVTYVSDPMISYTTGAKQVVVAATIRNQGEVVGMIGGALPWEDIQRRIAATRDALKSGFSTETRFFLISNTGTYWYHWNPDKIVRLERDADGAPRINDIGEKVVSRSLIMDEPIAELAEAGTKLVRGERGHREFTDPETGKAAYVVYAPVVAADYGIGLIVPKDELLAPVRDLQRQLLINTAMAIGLAILIASLLARRIAAPITSLSSAAKALADGEWRPLHVRGKGEEAELANSFNHMADALRQREGELRASEERFSLAMLGANDGVWDWDRNTGDMYFSPRLTSMLGYAQDELRPNWKALHELIHPDDRPAVDKVLAAVFAGTRSVFQAEYRIRHRYGHYLNILSRAYPVRSDENGAVSRLVGTHVDITDQKQIEQEIRSLNQKLEERVESRTRDLETLNTSLSREVRDRRLAENALRESKQQLSAAQRIAGIAHWVWDVNDGRFEWSEHAEEIFPIVCAHFDGSILPFLAWVHPEDRDRVREAIVTAVLGDGRFNVDHRLYPIRGELIYVNQVGEFTEENDGLHVSITGTVRDISQQKRVDRLKDQFVSVISHELRTPLTSIYGALGLLNGGAVGKLPQQAADLVVVAQKNSQRLLDLINDILDLDKSQSGELTYELKRQFLLPLIRESIEEIREYGKQFRVGVRLLTTSADAEVNVDAQRMKQILANLLSNAIKFSSVNDVVEVQVSRPVAGRVRVSIHDHGSGIPQQFQDRLFDRFSQADGSDTRKVSGTGLGLSISKSLIENMGGIIDFRSTAEEGTTFFFELKEVGELGPDAGVESEASGKSQSLG